MKRVLTWLILSGSWGILLANLGWAIAQDLPASQEPTWPEPVEQTVAEITSRELGGHLRFIASDLMGGRDTASAEIEIVAEYLAGHLQGFGAEPVGDLSPDGQRTYFHAFPLIRRTIQADRTNLTLAIAGDQGLDTQQYPPNDDYQLSISGLTSGTYEGSVVFAKNATNLDDLDLDGKVLLILEPQQRSLFGITRRLRQDVEDLGVVAVLVVQRFDDQPAEPYRERTGRFFRPLADTSYLVRRESFDSDDQSTSVPVLLLENTIRDRIDASYGISVEDPPRGPLEGLEFTLELAGTNELTSDNNVIGLFPGSDPELADEVIIYSAHYDHLGTRGDAIYNGADDNGSGTSALLEIAEAFGEGPRPRRSIAFLWVSGEEKGLWGSRYFAANNPLPENYRIVANINMDMVSRNNSGEIGLTPSPNHPDYSTLTTRAVESCEIEGLEVLFNADRYYRRTDSYNFARIGIPVIFLFSGVHEDYHRATDTVEKADTEKAGRIARACYRLGWLIAQDDQVPQSLVEVEDDSEEGDDPR